MFHIYIGHISLGLATENNERGFIFADILILGYIHMNKYIYIYTLRFQFTKCLRLLKPDGLRKPDMCPVSEEKFRKPVLVGLRSNNEMNIFGFRRCYGKKK